MRHPFTTQLRRARTAAAIEARNRPAQGAGPGRQVPRLLVWSGVTLPRRPCRARRSSTGRHSPWWRGRRARPAGRTGAGDRHPAGAGGAVELLQPRHPDVAGGTEGSDAGGRHPARAVRAVDLLLPRHSHVAGGTQGLDAGEGTGRHLDSAACPGAPPARPGEPNGQPTWLVVSLGGLAAVLALVAGLAVLATRRANRRARVGPAT
jgi:hypothetical protein